MAKKPTNGVMVVDKPKFRETKHKVAYGEYSDPTGSLYIDRELLGNKIPAGYKITMEPYYND